MSLTNSQQKKLAELRKAAGRFYAISERQHLSEKIRAKSLAMAIILDGKASKILEDAKLKGES